jgi:hypothetical protein
MGQLASELSAAGPVSQLDSVFLLLFVSWLRVLHVCTVGSVNTV